MVLLYPINFLLYFDFNKTEFLEKSLEEVNASSLANIEKGRVMFYEFGVGLSKAYLRLPQALR